MATMYLGNQRSTAYRLIFRSPEHKSAQGELLWSPHLFASSERQHLCNQWCNSDETSQQASSQRLQIYFSLWIYAEFWFPWQPKESNFKFFVYNGLHIFKLLCRIVPLVTLYQIPSSHVDKSKHGTIGRCCFA